MDSDLVDIVDENNCIIGTTTRKEVNEKKLRHRTCYVLVFNSKNELLITKRADTKYYAPGKWEIGQGGVAEKGESYEDNARRELREEVGIEAKELKYLFDFRYESSLGRFFAKTYSVYSDGPYIFQESEIKEGRFVPLDLLEKMVRMNPSEFADDSVKFLPTLLDFIKK